MTVARTPPVIIYFTIFILSISLLSLFLSAAKFCFLELLHRISVPDGGVRTRQTNRTRVNLLTPINASTFALLLTIYD